MCKPPLIGVGGASCSRFVCSFGYVAPAAHAEPCWVSRDSNSREDQAMTKRSAPFPPGIRVRAVRMDVHVTHDGEGRPTHHRPRSIQRCPRKVSKNRFGGHRQRFRVRGLSEAQDPSCISGRVPSADGQSGPCRHRSDQPRSRV